MNMITDSYSNSTGISNSFKLTIPTADATQVIKGTVSYDYADNKNVRFQVRLEDGTLVSDGWVESTTEAIAAVYEDMGALARKGLEEAIHFLDGFAGGNTARLKARLEALAGTL